MTNDQIYRDHLRRVSSALQKIHRLIMENEIEELERREGVTIAAAGRLQLLLTAPELAWLRALSQEMAAVDEVYFQKEPITEAQARKVHADVDRLMVQAEETEFAQKYRDRLIGIPDLMLDHGHLRLALRKFNEALTGN